MTPDPRPSPTRVQLPRNSTRLHRGYAHCKVVLDLGKGEFGAAFEGPIYQAGAVVDREKLGPHAVVLECVGPGPGGKGRGRTEFLWILWQYQKEEWKELGRAQSINWEWAEALRPLAQRALHPVPELLDVLQLGRDLAEAISQVIDQKLEKTPESLKKSVVSALYDRLGGKLAG